MRVAVITAYVHKFLVNPASNKSDLSISNKVCQLLSAVPFWCGEYGALFSCLIWFFAKFSGGELFHLRNVRCIAMAKDTMPCLKAPWTLGADCWFTEVIQKFFLKNSEKSSIRSNQFNPIFKKHYFAPMGCTWLHGKKIHCGKFGSYKTSLNLTFTNDLPLVLNWVMMVPFSLVIQLTVAPSANSM